MGLVCHRPHFLLAVWIYASCPRFQYRHSVIHCQRSTPQAKVSQVKKQQLCPIRYDEKREIGQRVVSMT